MRGFGTVLAVEISEDTILFLSFPNACNTVLAPRDRGFFFVPRLDKADETHPLTPALFPTSAGTGPPRGWGPGGTRLQCVGLVIESSYEAAIGGRQVIPLRDENPTRTVPYVTVILIIINVLVFLMDRVGAHGHMGALAGLAMVPREVVTGQDLPPFGPHPVWLTVFTSMFMHANLLHIGGNMLYLWIFGNNIEDTVGRFMFVVFYAAGGVAAAAAHILSTAANPAMAAVPTVGASGAIAAVLGAYLILFPTARIICLVTLGYLLTTTAVPAMIVLVLWIVLQVISVSVIGGTGAGGGVAYWAHIGGFIAGVILIYLMGGKRLLRRRRGNGYYRRSYDYW